MLRGLHSNEKTVLHFKPRAAGKQDRNEAYSRMNGRQKLVSRN
jgi:hypothetical protein